MAHRLFPTLRLARQLSREMSPWWAVPRPSFWWDYPQFPIAASNFFKDHVSLLDRLTQPADASYARHPGARHPATNTTYYKYTIVSKPKESVHQQSEDTIRESQSDEETNTTADQETSPQEFQVSFDLNEFSPGEIQVKLLDDTLLQVEAKHTSEKDGNQVERYFSHYCHLPGNVDTSALKSTISKNGTLRMTAPLISVQDIPPVAEKIIPIQQATDGPADGPAEKTGETRKDETS